MVSVYQDNNAYKCVFVSSTNIINNTENQTNRMTETNLPEIQSFSENIIENEAVFCCRQCYVDIFLETNILVYIPDDNAYFVKQKESINFKSGHYTRINCSNCNAYLGRVVYSNENQLRLTGIVPKYTFR